MNSSYNFVPGVMGLILMLICGMGLTMPTMMLSGIIFPCESMPGILQAVSYIIPAVSPSPGAALAQGSIDTVETYRYNPRQDYKLFMVPALIVIAITMMCGFMPALNIVSEKSVS